MDMTKKLRRFVVVVKKFERENLSDSPDERILEALDDEMNTIFQAMDLEERRFTFTGAFDDLLV